MEPYFFLFFKISMLKDLDIFQLEWLVRSCQINSVDERKSMLLLLMFLMKPVLLIKLFVCLGPSPMTL